MTWSELKFGSVLMCDAIAVVYVAALIGRPPWLELTAKDRVFANLLTPPSS